MKKVTLTVNGKKQEFEVAEDTVLLDLLREDLKLTGAKQSCDRKGQCGACTVIVNKKAVRSCLRKVADLEGADVITVEGLGTPDNPHLIQEAFVLAGAIQCGFCTPGMIMSTKVLLDSNPNPSVEEIKKALARNLCRCTGYKKIIEAVQLAAAFIRGENSPEKVRAAIPEKAMGVSHPRPSAILKACGVAEFTADIQMEDALELAAVHSPEFHAIIKSIDTSAAEKMPGVVGVMTSKDIKGTNRIRLMRPDQPVLCECGDKVRTYGDPVALVVAQTRQQARDAAAAVKVEYEPLPVVLDPAEAMKEGAPKLYDEWDNLCYQQPLIKGDAAKALAEATYTVEQKFSTQINHQASLEPEHCSGYWDKETGELVIAGRSINIHGHLEQLKEATGHEAMRYREPFVGGQFGIKATISSEGLVAAACVHFKRNIRYQPSLEESMWISSKRHPFKTTVKLGADKDGHLTAFDIDMLVDKGSYFILAGITVVRALGMLTGAYNIPNVNALGRVVYTNNPWGGAARGAGPPQSTFGLEVAAEMLAQKMGIDSLEFRRMNAMKTGDAKATGTKAQVFPFIECCNALQSHYDRAKKDAAEFNAKSDGKIKHGVGLGTFAFGIGSHGDMGRVSLEVDPDDGVTVYGAVADPGEGNESMLIQIAAHLLELPVERVRIYTRDTDKTVGMGPAAGSRITFLAGGALQDACKQLKAAWKESSARTYQALKDAGKPTRFDGVKKVHEEGKMDPKTGQGGSFDTDVQNLQLVEIEVNTETGEAKVLKVTTVVDAGNIIHPQNLEGQLEGGMDQGVGYALREEYIPAKTKDWITFKFPTIGDSFPMEIITMETPRPSGPVGATGIGEMTMVSTAPGVISAIKDACGVWICDLPATPEKIKAALAAQK